MVETLSGEEIELLDAGFRADSLVGALLRDGRGRTRTAIAVGELRRVRTKEIDKERSTFLVAGVAVSLFLFSWYMATNVGT